jgi:hypothetical protein
MKQHFCPAEQSMIAFEKECNWCGELESQEPVAWRWETHNGYAYSEQHYEGENGQPLYTHPPQRTWVGLTSHERMMCRSFYPDEAVAKTEAKLKEKNT